MAATTPTKEPATIRAGDTAIWSKTLSDYPASDGWTLTYYILGPSRLAVVATADGDDYTLTIPASDSANLTAGRYSIEGKVSLSGATYTVFAGSVVILPNLSDENSTPAGTDVRSFNRRVRDSLRQMWEGTAEHPEIAYTIFGERNVQLIPLEDRWNALQRFENLVATEEAQERASRGERNGLFIRFTEPR